jgi:hypothetical protein
LHRWVRGGAGRRDGHGICPGSRPADAVSWRHSVSWRHVLGCSGASGRPWRTADQRGRRRAGQRQHRSCAAFIAKMNATAAELGMTSTHFTSFDGVPYPTEHSTYSTPADLVTLGAAAMKFPLFRAIVARRHADRGCPARQPDSKPWLGYRRRTAPAELGLRPYVTAGPVRCICGTCCAGCRWPAGSFLL